VAELAAGVTGIAPLFAVAESSGVAEVAGVTEVAGGAGGGGGGGAGGLTATIVPGTSIPVNLAQACDQPAGVSGHHSSGCACGAPATQIP
jgi:hypothetical protein